MLPITAGTGSVATSGGSGGGEELGPAEEDSGETWDCCVLLEEET